MRFTPIGLRGLTGPHRSVPNGVTRSARQRSQSMLGSPRFLKSGHTVRSDSWSTRSMRAQSAGAFRPTLRSAATDGWVTLTKQRIFTSYSRLDGLEWFESPPLRLCRLRQCLAPVLECWRTDNTKGTKKLHFRFAIQVLGTHESLFAATMRA